MPIFVLRDIPQDIWDGVKRRANIEARQLKHEKWNLAYIIFRLLRVYAAHGIDHIERVCPPATGTSSSGPTQLDR